MSPLTCQVSAKYSPDNTGLFPFKRHLESAGFRVAYPVGDAIIEYTLGFAVTVPAERETPFHLTEIDFLRSIYSSQVQIAYNVWADRDGYVGESTAVETAFALMIGRPVIAVRPLLTFSPDLAPEVADILQAHRHEILVDPLDRIPQGDLQPRVANWLASDPPRASLSALERTEILIQASQLACKYQASWAEYQRIRDVAREEAASELVGD